MKKKITNSFWAMAIGILLAGCSPAPDQSRMESPVVTAINRSLAFAHRDNIDKQSYMVRSAATYSNGKTSVIKSENPAEYELSVIRNLFGKKYWEVCYGTAMPGLVGATYCYYLDRFDYGLLSEYKVK